MFLYEEDSFLPETETEFYQDFTLSSLVRSMHKSSEKKAKPTSLDQLPPKEKLYFDRICHLAFEATVKSRQVFRKSEISSICDEGSMNDKESPGLLVIDRYFAKFDVNETYSFLHLTLQEYLSAFHIAGCDDNKQVTIITSHSHLKHLYVVWCFLFGMLDYSKESTVNLFKLILDSTRDNLLLHIQCAYESHRKSTCTDVLCFHEYNLGFKQISASDLTCIIYILNTADYTTIKLNFIFCDFCVDEAAALLKGVGDHQLSLTML